MDDVGTFPSSIDNPERLRLPDSVLDVPIKKSAFRGRLYKAADLAFDFATFFVNLGDVITDAMICYEWYKDGYMTFFWLSVAVFFISQVAYSVLFVTVYASHHGDCQKIVLFLVVFPFSQVVPFLLWIESYDMPWLKSIFNRFDLRTSSDPQFNPNEDPLRAYILKKVRAHGGFVTEAVIESVPQSILQMISIVVHKNARVVDVVSLGMSILSVASRGFLLSYSPHRPTFIFNFTCFVADVFGVFCIVAWLFFIPTEVVTRVYHVSYLPTVNLNSIFTVIWLDKFFVVFVMTAILGVLLIWWLLIYRYYATSNMKQYINDLFIIAGIFTFGGILLAPTLVVIEALTLSMFPLLVFRSIGKDRSGKLGRRLLVTFLQEATSPKDYEIRFRTVKNYFRGWMGDNDVDGEKTKSEMLKEATKNLWERYTTRLKKLHKGGYSSNFPKALAFVWATVFCLPVYIFSSLYNLFYPIMLLASTPFSAVHSLQLTLTLVVFGCYGVMLLLAFPVHHYYQWTKLLPVSIDHTNARLVVMRYEDYRERKLQYNNAKFGIWVANARSNEGSPLTAHITDLFPEISLLAGFSSPGTVLTQGKAPEQGIEIIGDELDGEEEKKKREEEKKKALLKKKKEEEEKDKEDKKKKGRKESFDVQVFFSKTRFKNLLEEKNPNISS